MKANKFLAIALAALALVGCKNGTDPKDDSKTDVSVNSVKLDKDVLQLKKGETAELKATVDPAGAAKVTWQSTAPEIATVVDGLVTAVAVGEANIVATADTKMARCKVTVYEEGETVITLDKVTAKIGVGETVTITASVQPAEKASQVVWASSNEAVATVANGVVTGVAAGEAKITATVEDKKAEATITVTGGGGGGEEINHPSLKGSEYFIFQLGGKAAEQIADKIVADFRPDGDKKNLWVWEGTYNAGETSGKNFYGEAEGWVSLTVTSVGWSGCAYACDDLDELNKLAVIMENPSDYWLHIGMKSTDNASHLVFLNGTSGAGKICIGSTAFVDGGTSYQPVQDFSRDGSWGEIEVNMQTLIDMGLVYGSNNTAGTNVFGYLSGGVTGTILQFDAAFIYKKVAN